uniref:Uncharacterized protein n=1 Tax=viral metagenome TaxID=1070528 RepID=A0A6C0JJW0_9ZZZZ
MSTFIETSIDEDEWETAVLNFKLPITEVSPVTTASVSPIPSDTEADEPIKQKKNIKNPYAKYPYFIASVKGTVAKALFPKAEHPLGSLKDSLKTPYGLTNFMSEVRNNYIKPLFYVLKSTAYFNPITKTRVPPKKSERVDPNLAFVALGDQVKVYKLFGFQGHVGSKKTDEDSKRAELLDYLKYILYDTNTFINFIQILLQHLFVEVDETDISRTCDIIRQQSEYEQKSYGLPEKWFHDAKWKKLTYVYGGSTIDNIGGGDGGFSLEMMQCMKKTAAFQV